MSKKQTEIERLEAKGIPAIWVDDEVITPEGKFDAETRDIRQTLSAAGFERNLCYLEAADGEGRWWGANPSAKARLSEMVAERKAKEKALAEEKARKDAEALKKSEHLAAYRDAVNAVEFPKGKKTAVTAEGTKGEKFTLEGTDYAGLMISKTLGRFVSEPYGVSHTGTGLLLAKFPSVSQAKDFIRGVIHSDVGLSFTKENLPSEEALARLRQVKAIWSGGQDVPAYF